MTFLKILLPIQNFSLKNFVSEKFEFNYKVYGLIKKRLYKNLLEQPILMKDRIDFPLPLILFYNHTVIPALKKYYIVKL